MDVLAYLLSHAGHVISLDEMLDQFWAGHAEPIMVAKRINQIRRALGDDVREPVYIETIPKRGYRTIAAVSFAGVANATEAKLPSALVASAPHHPAIAVLPFTNLSDDPEQEYFSDGLTEDIITDLSLIPGLLVVARNSTFTYKVRLKAG